MFPYLGPKTLPYSCNKDRIISMLKNVKSLQLRLKDRNISEDKRQLYTFHLEELRKALRKELRTPDSLI